VTIEKVARAMPWSLGARMLAFAAGFAGNIVIVRSLGAVGWGTLSVLRTILGFAIVLVMLGLDAALVKFIPLLRVSGGLKGFFKTFRGLVVLQLSVWVVLIAAAHFGSGAAARLFGDGSARFGLYLQIALALAIFEIFLQLLSNTLQSFYETRRIAAGVACGNALYIALLIVVLRAGYGVVGVLSAAAASNLCIALVLAPRAAGLAAAATSGPGPSAASVLRFSLPFVVTGILNQIVWRQSEVLFLGHFRGAAEAGYFSLAYRTPQLLLEFVPLTVYPLIMAGSSEVFARDERNLARAVDLYYRLLYLLVVPVAAFGFAFARPLVPILYGSEMIPAASLTQLFFVVFSYSFLYTPLSMALYVMGKSWINMLIFLSLAILNVGLDLLLVPRYGLWGAMIPVPVVLTAAIVLFRAVMRRERPDVRIPAGFIVRCAAAALPLASLAIPAARWGGTAALAIMIPCGVALLYAGFRLMRVIGDEEKELIRKLPIPMKERLLGLF
jgi:O-antigen/teichoic acid export membrane protein